MRFPPLLPFRQITRNVPQRLKRGGKLQFENGRFQVVGLGAWYSYWRDPYHLLLTIPWVGFITLASVIYIVVNTLFAVAYLIGGDCIANAESGSFWDAFFFSVQTLGSIGYGAMYPTTIYANLLVTLEALTSILAIALMTGLAFARFAQPTAKVIFSRVAVISQYNGTPTLIFRAANQRHNQILEAKLGVYLMKDEISLEGQFMRRVYDLKLLRNYTPNFTLTWTAMHPIDDHSALRGETVESLTQSKAMILISLTGIDETVAQSIHTRHVYGVSDIFWNHQLVDIIREAEDGHRYIDYTHFHEVVPEEEGLRD